MSDAPTYPSESASRRPCWTRGWPLPLGGGETWFLPAVDHSIIPLLPRLMPTADPLNVEMVERFYEHAPDRPGMGGRILAFVRLAVEAQYDCPAEEVRRLVDDFPEAEGNTFMESVDHFLHELIGFATASVPYVPGVDPRGFLSTN